jgi:hypothetical protein
MPRTFRQSHQCLFTCCGTAVHQPTAPFHTPPLQTGLSGWRGGCGWQDINEEPAPRMFWPKEVWGQYASSLEDFKEPANAEQAVACLNHLVTDALRHVPECFEYMSKLTSPSVLSFCAIPQVGFRDQEIAG